MHQPNRALRVGLTALFCAALLRLWTAGAPETLLHWWESSELAAIWEEKKTGREVRFSPSLGVFSPDFVESPPAAAPKQAEWEKPAFSDPESIQLYYEVSKAPDIAALLTKPLVWDLRGEAPTVLILHTHSTESYTRGEESYVESAKWRTLDEHYNMLSIGALVAQTLAEAGIPTIQHRELNDYPSYNGSYTRARKIIAGYLKEYPTIQLVLDLHRDASEGTGGQLRTRAQVAGETSAQLMLVLGTNHEGYEENLSLALKLHAQLEQTHPGLMRPLQLRSSRFNQDQCPGSLLVEVGAAGNSRAEALRAAQALAQGIIALAEGANLLSDAE